MTTTTVTAEQSEQARSLTKATWWTWPGMCTVALVQDVPASHSGYVSTPLTAEEKQVANRLLLFGLECAWHVLPNWRARFPLDDRLEAALSVARRYLNGQATRTEVEIACGDLHVAEFRPRMSFWRKLDLWLLGMPKSCYVMNGPGYAYHAAELVVTAVLGEYPNLSETISSVSHYGTESAWHYGREYQEFKWQVSKFNAMFSERERQLIRDRCPIKNLNNGPL